MGLTLSSGGLLSGTPTIAGTSSFTLIATDTNGCTGSLLYAFIINPPACPTILLAPSPLPSGTADVLYSQVISATGGMAPYTFALASGACPWASRCLQADSSPEPRRSRGPPASP